MTGKIPEALAVLDLFISAYVDGQVPDSDQVAMRKARAAFAELIKASQETINYSFISNLSQLLERQQNAIDRVKRLP